MNKYLVKKRKNYSGKEITEVYQILQEVETNYGVVLVVRYYSVEDEFIQPYFLEELLKEGYVLSEDEQYKNYING